jgi:hypothetical protein
MARSDDLDDTLKRAAH